MSMRPNVRTHCLWVRREAPVGCQLIRGACSPATPLCVHERSAQIAPPVSQANVRREVQTYRFERLRYSLATGATAPISV